ncbi:FAD-binding oxidoreductase [Sneathiella aquimaris]|uniref:FAD-binding oxidoreductase n=1 Tax=Sneathiella aquimaris TaxID=2599305 RepID=UPI00146D3E76|nr:2Fe-2S iron-sulfur cluster binding domain-containing protein [Sneathiella aquimaris]
MPILNFDGRAYKGHEKETVLDILLKAGEEISHSCKTGRCQGCILHCKEGDLLPVSQNGLDEELTKAGYFLSCKCPLRHNLEVASPETNTFFQEATVVKKRQLSDRICQITLRVDPNFEFLPGQFVNLGRSDGVLRSYTLAGLPTEAGVLEIHVEKRPAGELSNWLYSDCRVGETLFLQGPHGQFYYRPERRDQSLLLLGSGAGLASLMGILRSALSYGHTGHIALYYTSNQMSGFYLHETLKELEQEHKGFHYFPCLSRSYYREGFRQGRADEVAFQDFPSLAGWKVYAAGFPSMVYASCSRAEKAGVELENIFDEPYEMKDLRRTQRR